MADETAQAIRDAALTRLGNLRPVFLTLHILGGLVGLPLLIITFLTSSTIPPQPALTNFCVTWVFNSVAYIMGSIGGATQTAPRSVCFAQAALIYGTPPMAASATLLVVIQIWRTFHDPISRRIYRGGFHCSEQVSLITTLSIPYLVFFAFLLISVVLEIKYPENIDRTNGLYCTMVGVPLRHWGVPIFCVIVLILILGFEVAVAIRYCSARKRIANSFPLANRSTSLGLVIRITLFNLYLLVTFGANLVFICGAVQSWAYMIQAALPVVAFLLFVTQRNVVLAWCLWRKRKKKKHSDENTSVRNPASDVKKDVIVAPAPQSTGEVTRV